MQVPEPLHDRSLVCRPSGSIQLPVLLALTLSLLPAIGGFAGHATWNLKPATSGTLNSSNTDTATRLAVPSQSRQLAFEDRVAYQRAIEEVYWRHRIWPKERPDRKPSLDAVISQAAIEQKVHDYLRDSELLDEEWQKPITSRQLQAEMDRMARHTKQPEVLRELFAALDNDPYVIAECLARPVLVQRLVSELKNDERLQLTRVAWLNQPLRSWLAKSETQGLMTIAAVTANYALPAISGQSNECMDDSWTATGTTNAPTARFGHTAVWTGSEMIIWGGRNENFVFANAGGRYNPSTDSWTATSTTNAPSARDLHSAVWSGSEMIVWGGEDSSFNDVNTGGRYNPGTDSWTVTSTTSAPTGRVSHTAVWTGSEMIVWGGEDNFPNDVNTGGRYNPVMNSWTATTTINAPIGREVHTAVWTGSEMVVWGGFNQDLGALGTGGRYNPGTDSWTATTNSNAPSSRFNHTAVWTGSEMIVWGGVAAENLDTGGRYNPATDSWTATSTSNAPSARQRHAAVWTGSEMIIWGGFFPGYLDTGGRYNPDTDSWTATTITNAPSGRESPTSVWTGTQMIVWGGFDGTHALNTGGRYCAQAPSPIMLSASRREIGGINTVRLKWRQATSTDIDVYRNGTLIVTTPNDGSYVDSTGDSGRARYTYQVCEAGTQTCSNATTVPFPR